MSDELQEKIARVVFCCNGFMYEYSEGNTGYAKNWLGSFREACQDLSNVEIKLEPTKEQEPKPMSFHYRYGVPSALAVPSSI